MPRPHTTMRQIRNVLRLRFAEKLSVRDTAASLAMARSTVSDYLNRARVAGLSWPLPEEMDDDEIDRLPPMALSLRRSRACEPAGMDDVGPVKS